MSRTSKAERNADLAADYQSGMTGPELARKYRLSHYRVYNLLKRAGINRRKRNSTMLKIIGPAGEDWGSADTELQAAAAVIGKHSHPLPNGCRAVPAFTLVPVVQNTESAEIVIVQTSEPIRAAAHD